MSVPRFKPKQPFRLHQHNNNFGNMSKNSELIGNLMKTHIDIGGINVYVYRLEGIHDQKRDNLGIKNTSSGNAEDLTTDIGSFVGIQDPILNENRDRKYNFEEVPVLRGVYIVSQNELDYAKYGMALANDVLTMEFHAKTMELEVGRRLIPGDVIELPHLREVGIDGRVVNKWYEIGSIVWSPAGYDPMYARHVLATICRPLRHQQEFLDLFYNIEDEYGRTLEEQGSNKYALMKITESNQNKANEHTPTVWWDTTILYYDPENPDIKPYRQTDDLIPPNGLPVNQGTSFPSNGKEGDWFVRIDFLPNRLYRLTDGKWFLKEYDRKRDWQPYNWIEKMREFMSDRSENDKSRPWKLHSIHDVLTNRENKSDPSPNED